MPRAHPTAAWLCHGIRHPWDSSRLPQPRAAPWAGHRKRDRNPLNPQKRAAAPGAIPEGAGEGDGWFLGGGTALGPRGTRWDPAGHTSIMQGPVWIRQHPLQRPRAGGGGEGGGEVGNRSAGDIFSIVLQR